jgi:general secretion pathway protein F
MALFRYTALTPAGQPADGELEGASAEEVIDRLLRRGLIPIEAAVSQGAPGNAPVASGPSPGRRLPTQEVVLFAQQLGRLLAARLPLDASLGIVAGLARGQTARASLATVLDRVRGGSGLATALAAQGQAYPRLLVATIRAGEEAGALPEVLGRAATLLARAEAVRQGIVSAMVYPAILAVTATGAIGVVLLVVLPQFEPLFAEAGTRLPAVTRAVMGVGHVVAAGWWVLPLLVLLGALAWRWAMARPGPARALSRLALRLPLLGGLVLRFNAAAFARTLAALLGNGVPAARALPLAVESVGNREMAARLAEAAARMTQGEGVAAPLAALRLLPDLLVRLVQVGEETGRLAELLAEAAEMLETEAQRRVERLVALLVPAMTILMGLAIAVVIAAVFLAMISINDLAG